MDDIDSFYWVMDGRANMNTDNAMVLCTCETIEDAYDIGPEFGDFVIVDPMTIIDGDYFKIDSSAWVGGITPKRGIALAKSLRNEKGKLHG